MYMDELKLYAKNEKELETLIQTVRIYSDDGIWHRKMSHAHDEKRKTVNRTTKLEKGNVQILWNTGSGYHKKAET